MSETGQWCVEPTSQEQDDVAGGRSAVPPLAHLRPEANARDYSQGQDFQKRIVLPDQERATFQFLQSGLPAIMEDEKASMAMMETAMPYIEKGTANFAFIFNQKLTVESSCFEQNRHFAKTRACGEGISGKVEAFVDSRSQLSFVRKRFKKGSCMRKEEVQSLLGLSHPGVVRVYALLCAHATVDLLLQDAGHPLRHCLKVFCEKKICALWYWQVVEDLARQGFEALRYIHQEGICHLDVKPENLVVHQASNKRLVLVLTDLGSSVTLTSTMTFNLGLTPEYWAPELWRHVELHLHKLRMSQGDKQGCHEFLPQCSFDTYSMGLCVYYMATLQHLVKELETLQKTHTPLVPPEDIQQACQGLGFHNSDFVFKLLLMKQFSHQLPQMVRASNAWLFPGISDTLLTLLTNTLLADPDHRWTDRQAVAFLSGKAEDCQVREDEPELKTPTPVQDTSPCAAGRSHPEQAQGHSLPEQQAPGLAAPTVESALQAGQPEGIMSTELLRYHQSIAPYIKCWNLDQATAGPSQGTAQVEEDDVICVDPQPSAPPASASHAQASASHAEAKKTGKEIFSFRTWTTVTDLCGDTDINNGAETDQVKGGDSKINEKGEGKRGWEGESEVGSLGATAKDRGGKPIVCPVLNVAENMEVLSMNSSGDSISTVPNKSSTVGGKGKAVGKGGGKRKPVKSGWKGERCREEVGKVMASSAITKPKSPEKRILRGKNLPLVSAQLKQAAAEIPFFVASSSRPKPSPRMMLGLPMTNADPRTMSVAEKNSLVLVRPPDMLSAREAELGRGDSIEATGGATCFQPQGDDFLLGDNSLKTRPKPVGDSAEGRTPQFVSDPWVQDYQQVCLPGSGSQSLVPAAQVSQPQQSEGVPLVADPMPTCWTAAQAPPQPAPSVVEWEPEVMDQAGVDELLRLLEADRCLEQFDTHLPESLGAEMLELILPEGGQADMNEEIPVVDMADGILGDELVAIMDEENIQGNLPNFSQLFG